MPWLLAAPISHILYPTSWLFYWCRSVLVNSVVVNPAAPFIILRAFRVLRGDNCSLAASTSHIPHPTSYILAVLLVSWLWLLVIRVYLCLSVAYSAAGCLIWIPRSSSGMTGNLVS